MDPLTLALIMGGVGLTKSFLVDQPKENRQRQLAAETQRYSPWTGLQAGPIQEADPFGSTLQGGAQGFAMGQNAQNYEGSKKLQEAQANYLNKMNGASASMDASPSMAPTSGNSSLDTGMNPYKMSRAYNRNY